MKSDYEDTSVVVLRTAVRQLLHGTLADGRLVEVLARTGSGAPLRTGYHDHGQWELFGCLHGSLRFESLDTGLREYPCGTLLLVPPGCLHVAVNYLEQPPDLRLLILNLPGDVSTHGSLMLVAGDGDRRLTLSPRELNTWTALLGARPEQLMEVTATALAAGEWGRERALAGLRLLWAAYMETADADRPAGEIPADRRVVTALALLETRYFDTELTPAGVAAAVGLSASHLSRLFRQATGASLHRTLVDIRLRRAADLLTRTERSVKDVAALTGWNGQLYFSAAFRRRYGVSPSDYRTTDALTGTG